MLFDTAVLGILVKFASTGHNPKFKFRSSSLSFKTYALCHVMQLDTCSLDIAQVSLKVDPVQL